MNQGQDFYEVYRVYTVNIYSILMCIKCMCEMYRRKFSINYLSVLLVRDGFTLNCTHHAIILWHVVPLLDNGRETSNYTTAVTRQHPVKSNRETVFSMRSVPRCCKHDKLGIADGPCGGGFEYLHRSLASRRRRRKGKPVLVGITVPPCSWGLLIRGPDPPGWGILESETVKYDPESHGTRTRA
jgi:hypothetical protein